MPRWPFALTAGRVDIAIALVPSSSSIVVVVKSPSRRPSPSSCRRAVHRHCATPSIAVNSPSRRPSPPIRCALGLSPLHLRCPLPSRSHHAVHGRRGAVAPSLAVEEPLRRPLLSRTVAASLLLLLLVLRSHPDLLPIGGVTVLPLMIRVHDGSRFPLPSLSCSLPPPSLLPCVPSPLRITLIYLLPLPLKQPLHPFCHRREQDAPLSLIQSRRYRRRCRPHHPARARRGSCVRSAGNGRRLHHRPPPSSSTLFDC